MSEPIQMFSAEALTGMAMFYKAWDWREIPITVFSLRCPNTYNLPIENGLGHILVIPDNAFLLKKPH